MNKWEMGVLLMIKEIVVEDLSLSPMNLLLYKEDIPLPSHLTGLLRLCLGVWRGGKERDLGGGKYRGKWRNLSHFLEEFF